MMKTTEFERDLSDLLNKYSKENASDTPDFVLAKYLNKCLETFNATIRDRRMFYNEVDPIDEKSNN